MMNVFLCIFISCFSVIIFVYFSKIIFEYFILKQKIIAPFNCKNRTIYVHDVDNYYGTITNNQIEVNNSKFMIYSSKHFKNKPCVSMIDVAKAMKISLEDISKSVSINYGKINKEQIIPIEDILKSIKILEYNKLMTAEKLVEIPEITNVICCLQQFLIFNH